MLNIEPCIVACITACCCSVPAAREQLKKLSVLPTHVLKEYPCLSYWSVFSALSANHIRGVVNGKVNEDPLGHLTPV